MGFYQTAGADVVVGADVGKGFHHLFALASSGEVLFDAPVANREPEIRSALERAARRGTTTVVSDQPGPLSALLFACARDMGMDTRFITPRAMHALLAASDPDRKDDAWDAQLIARGAIESPRLLKSPRRRHIGLAAELEMRRIDSLEKTALMNRLHDKTLSECPAFEAAVSDLGFDSDLAIFMLRRWGGPLGLRRCGRANLRRAVLATRGMGPAAAGKADAVYSAAASQRTVPEGAAENEAVVAQLASRLAECLGRLAEREAAIEGMLEREPAAAILMSMPGIGPITAATFLAEVGDASGFRSGDALAHYFGLSPKRAKSGSSLDAVSKSVSCNRRARSAMILAANAARMVAGTPSAAYYERRRRPDEFGRREGHYHALVALARKMVGVLWAMLRDGAMYERRMTAR